MDKFIVVSNLNVTCILRHTYIFIYQVVPNKAIIIESGSSPVMYSPEEIKWTYLLRPFHLLRDRHSWFKHYFFYFGFSLTSSILSDFLSLRSPSHLAPHFRVHHQEHRSPHHSSQIHLGRVPVRGGTLLQGGDAHNTDSGLSYLLLTSCSSWEENYSTLHWI